MVDERNEGERRWRDTLQRQGLARDYSVLQCMENNDEMSGSGNLK